MKNINKKITIITFIIIIIALIAFIVTEFSKHTEPIPDSDPINNVSSLFIEEYAPKCAIHSNLLRHDLCTLNLSKEAKSDELCHLISNETYKEECYNLKNN